MPQNLPKDVIFDLDGVLSTRDTFSALLLARFRGNPVALARALPAFRAWLRSRGDVAANTVAAHRLSTIALGSMGDDRYGEIAAAMGAKLGRDPRWVRADVVRLLLELKDAGHRVVVATASERRLAEAFLRAIGARWDLLLASEFRWNGGRVELVAHLRAAAKREALAKAGVAVSESRFYTDSYDDHPTAAAAGELVLVYPSASSVQRYSDAGLEFDVIPRPAAGESHRG
jgi:phosphatidylglycerophosphatase C